MSRGGQILSTSADNLVVMTAAFDHMGLSELVGLLTEEEQQELRPIVLRLVGSHPSGISAGKTGARRHRLSFTGTVEAAPDFAATSRDVLRRQLGGSE